jgi:hypothetical protein
MRRVTCDRCDRFVAENSYSGDPSVSVNKVISSPVWFDLCTGCMDELLAWLRRKVQPKEPAA